MGWRFEDEKGDKQGRETGVGGGVLFIVILVLQAPPLKSRKKEKIILCLLSVQLFWTDYFGFPRERDLLTCRRGKVQKILKLHWPLTPRFRSVSIEAGAVQAPPPFQLDSPLAVGSVVNLSSRSPETLQSVIQRGSMIRKIWVLWTKGFRGSLWLGFFNNSCFPLPPSTAKNAFIEVYCSTEWDYGHYSCTINDVLLPLMLLHSASHSDQMVIEVGFRRAIRLENVGS